MRTETLKTIDLDTLEHASGGRDQGVMALDFRSGACQSQRDTGDWVRESPALCLGNGVRPGGYARTPGATWNELQRNAQRNIDRPPAPAPRRRWFNG